MVDAPEPPKTRLTFYVVIATLVGGLSIFAFFARESPVEPSSPVDQAVASRPVPLERKELALNGGKGLALSVREPVSDVQIAALLGANSSGYSLVRIFTYRPDQQVGKDAAAGLWEWTVTEGLKRRY